MRKPTRKTPSTNLEISETDLSTVSGGRIRYIDDPDLNANGGDAMGTGTTYGDAIGGTLAVITTSIPC